MRTRECVFTLSEGGAPQHLARASSGWRRTSTSWGTGAPPTCGRGEVLAAVERPEPQMAFISRRGSQP